MPGIVSFAARVDLPDLASHDIDHFDIVGGRGPRPAEVVPPPGRSTMGSRTAGRQGRVPSRRGPPGETHGGPALHS